MNRPQRTRHCGLCGNFEENDFHDHKNTGRHVFNYVLQEYNKCRKKHAIDRNGITVATSLCNDYNNNNVEVDGLAKPGHFIVKITPETFEQIGKQLQFKYTIRNSSTNKYKVRLTILYPFAGYTVFPENRQYVMESGTICSPTVKFSLETTTIGSYKIPMVLTVEPFEETKKSTYFDIFKHIVVYLRDEGPEMEVAAKSPFKGEKWNDVCNFVGPVKSPRLLNEFPIPHHLYKIFMFNLENFSGMDFNEQLWRDEIRRLLENGLTESNYPDFLHNLLWLDEAAAILGLMYYNMTNVNIKLIRGALLELEVPGLAEKRPSIVLGDLVNLRLQGDHTAYQGVVTNINDSDIYISHVHPEFLMFFGQNPDCEIDVKFEFSRLQYERMHKGVDMCVRKGMLRTLFPSPYINENNDPIHLHRNDLYSTSIASNPHQLCAVENILNNTSQKAPYIVFGPPGTGKTTTIVEAILQINKNYPKKRILICAPSNSACDMLCAKLSQHCNNPKELLRIHSLTRNSNDIEADIKRFSNLEGSEFIQITGKMLKEYKLVVATLHLIGKFTGDYSPDCLFIDEAAQATEPECAIPIGLLVFGTQVILAGDPKQLGPVCSSDLAKNYGLEVSLMDRLMGTNQLYQPRNANASNYDPDYLTMLRINYRSHKNIIDIPNELFYSNSLECQGNQNDMISKMFVSMKVLKNKNMLVMNGCSVEFCGILSKEERKGTSPSYFNESEIQMVIKYVRVLCENSQCRVKDKDIGIIAPYIRQVHIIKSRLKQKGYTDIEVGTTESFQGREKRVMIISTVRAQHSLLKYDRKYNLGFVKHERRFNVALTRAQSKLIIIGNPICLGYDRKCWLRLIEFCENHNAYFGFANLERTNTVINNITSRFTTGKINTKYSNEV